MADFTSTQSGNWNDGATWGNTSPGVKGTDWPGNVGDTFTVDTGHEVIYNVEETNELGASAINGTLTFITNGNTKLTFGNVTLTIGATGILNRGSAVTPVDAAYTSELIFNTTSDNGQGISITDSGHVFEYGDPDYCTSWETTLANNAENTDDDAVIITNDNMDGDWHAGDELTIKREDMGDSSSYTDAVVKRTIQSISGTTITLTETLTGVSSGVGSTWVSEVVNVTRNVKTYKYGAVTDIQSSSRYNTNRPYLIDYTSGTNTNVWSHVQFTGMYRIQVDGAEFDNCIIRNGERGFSSINNNTMSGNIYSCNNGIIYSNNNTMSGNIYSCNYGIISINNNTMSGNIYSCNNGINYSDNNTMSGNIYSCNYGFRYSNNNTMSGNIYSCNNGINYSDNNTMSGKLGYDNSDNSYPNTYDVRNSYLVCKNCKMPLAGIVIYDENDIGGTSFVSSEHDDKVLNSHKTYQVMGSTVKTPCDGTGDTPSVDPDGGNADCIEVSNLQSNLYLKSFIKIFNDYRYSIYAQASVSKTYTFKIQSIFTDTLQNTEISLEAKYMNGADGALTLITSSETIAARSGDTDWSQSLSVTINPAQTGFIYFQIKLKKYESGKKIFIWPEVGIA